jgi:hypothetical protein
MEFTRVKALRGSGFDRYKFAAATFPWETAWGQVQGV